MRRNITKLFESREGHLDYRIKRDYIRNGIATIPCSISDYSDVISSYSVKGYETLDPGFVDFLKDSAGTIPEEYPLVLNIVGPGLSQEEKKTIEEVILDDTAYDLGIVERDEKRHTKVFWLMFIGLLIFELILFLTRSMADEPRELIFITLYFMGDTLCDYLFLTGYDLRKARRQAGRLASIKVIFSEEFKDMNYTDGDIDKLYSEIERDVQQTIEDEQQ